MDKLRATLNTVINGVGNLCPAMDALRKAKCNPALSIAIRDEVSVVLSKAEKRLNRTSPAPTNPEPKKAAPKKEPKATQPPELLAAIASLKVGDTVGYDEGKASGVVNSIAGESVTIEVPGKPDTRVYETSITSVKVLEVKQEPKKPAPKKAKAKTSKKAKK